MVWQPPPQAPQLKDYVNKGGTFVWEAATTLVLIRTFILLVQVPFGFWPILLVGFCVKINKFNELCFMMHVGPVTVNEVKGYPSLQLLF